MDGLEIRGGTLDVVAGANGGVAGDEGVSAVEPGIDDTAGVGASDAAFRASNVSGCIVGRFLA